MSLFREEVFRRRADSLHGTINIAVPTSWHVISSMLFGMVVVVAIFVSTASYSRTETAAGSISPAGGILQIMPTRPGRVDEIRVTEGQLVEAGTPLARIRVEEGTANGGAPTAILNAIGDQERNLDRQAGFDSAAAVSERLAYQAQIDSARAELGTMETQIATQQKLISIAQNDLDTAKGISARGFISRRDIRVREETLLARQQQLASLEQNRAAKLGGLSQVLQLQQQANDRAAAEDAQLGVSRAEIQKQKANARADQGYQLTAPASGRVAALSLNVGEPVTTQTVAMMIVPSGGRMIARLYIPGKAAGFVRKGQAVELAFEAYPYDRFGVVGGTIAAKSSAPILRPGSSGVLTPFYVATIDIPDPSIRAYGRREQLLPGMAFSARIVIEKRSLLQWLLDPLIAAAR